MLRNIRRTRLKSFTTVIILVSGFIDLSIAILRKSQPSPRHSQSDLSFSESDLKPQILSYTNSSQSPSPRSNDIIKKSITVANLGELCGASNENEVICPTNAACTETEASSKYTCMCNEMYTANADNSQCVKAQGSPCNHNPNECQTRSTFLFCINSVCKCEDTDYYNPKTKKCEGRVKGLCFNGVKECVKNAKCIHRYHNHHPYSKNDKNQHNFHSKGNSGSSSTTSSKSSNNLNSKKVVKRASSSSNYATVNSNTDIEETGRCECDQGYVESAHGFCKKGYGVPCASSNQGDYDFEYECDGLNLVCKDGMCDCPDSLQIYDKESQSCVALAGAKCSQSNIESIGCVDGALCKRLNLKLDGRCHCGPDSIELPDRTCGKVSLWRPAF